jgi:hypothetical protein
MATFRRAAGLIAAALLLITGILMTTAGMPLFGVPLAIVGLATSLWQIRRLYATRTPPEDPYDLSRLWDYGPPTNEEPNLDPSDPFEKELLRERSENATFYCHNCGHAVPDLFANCPECGQRLR